MKHHVHFFQSRKGSQLKKKNTTCWGFSRARIASGRQAEQSPAIPTPSIYPVSQRGMRRVGSCQTRCNGQGACTQEHELSSSSCSSQRGSGWRVEPTATRQQHTRPPLQRSKKQPVQVIFSWTALLLRRLINQKHLSIEIKSQLPSETYHFNNIIYSSFVAIWSPKENWLLQHVAITF